MPNKSSTAVKSKTLTSSKPAEKKEDGVLRITCPACGASSRYKRGRVKNPTVKEVDQYLMKAQCRFCGQLLRVKRKA